MKQDFAGTQFSLTNVTDLRDWDTNDFKFSTFANIFHMQWWVMIYDQINNHNCVDLQIRFSMLMFRRKTQCGSLTYYHNQSH